MEEKSKKESGRNRAGPFEVGLEEMKRGVVKERRVGFAAFDEQLQLCYSGSIHVRNRIDSIK